MLDEYFLAHDEQHCLTSDRTLSNLSNPRMDQKVGVHHYFLLNCYSESEEF